tara:strand:+ start:1165 stop:1935 length:771 start_codon:yes stop_codon:yes gene_type:complete
MTEQIIKYDNFDNENIEYTEPKKIGNIYYSKISYNNSPLYLQTSRMRNKTDIKKVNTIKPFDLKFEMNNSNMYKCLTKLDESNINAVTENSSEWFGKTLSIENSENMYRKITKPLQKNKKNSVNFKVPIINEEILCKIYNQDKIDINMDDILADQECILIIHVRGIKFFKSYYICDFYITHIKTFSKLSFSIPENCLIEDEIKVVDKVTDNEIIDEEIISKEKKEKENKKKIMEEKRRELEELQNKIKLLSNEIIE